MIAHAAAVRSPATVVIRSADTDVLMITLSSISKIDENKTIYLETGLASKNTHKFINVTALSKELGVELSNSLAGFHAYTGCDQIPSFAGKGKLNPLKILKNNKSYQKAFAALGSSEIIPDETLQQIEKYTCELYKITKHTDEKMNPEVDDARFQLFASKYEPKKKTKAILQVKGIDGSSLPPCKSAFIQQVRRANCVSSVWNVAHSFKSKMFPAETNGWILKSNPNGNSQYAINWFEGEMMPKKLEEIIDEEEPTQPTSPGDEVQQGEEDERDDDDDLDNDTEEEEARDEEED